MYLGLINSTVLSLIVGAQSKTEQLASKLASLTPGFSGDSHAIHPINHIFFLTERETKTKRTGCTGADISNACNEAALHAARVGRALVVREDFDYALDRIIGGQSHAPSFFFLIFDF